ncbi:MAG: alpha-amylase family glycosyl hydrolase, partial [Lachnospiraceae bacterium]|nr:alpha-amylase family glycosyl hydrolase [Lachnospiraceae bacterium]
KYNKMKELNNLVDELKLSNMFSNVTLKMLDSTNGTVNIILELDDSKYKDWYSFGADKEDYKCWWGIKDLPSVNELTKSYIDFIYGDKDSVIKYWMKKGVVGYRLDVADELPDSFIEGIRNAMKETDDDSVLIGEVWEDASNKISYGEKRKYLFGSELQSVMNYPYRDSVIDFMKGKISAMELVSICMHYMENYPVENFYSTLNILDSHDKERVLTILGDVEEKDIPDNQKKNYRLDDTKRLLAKRRLKVLSTMQFTIVGVPCIYYGDEVGLEGFRDPYNRGTYPWGHEDVDILSHYIDITSLRSKSDVLKKGDLKLISMGEHVFGYIREYKGKKMICLFNRAIFDNEICHIELDLSDDKDIDRYKNLLDTDNEWHIENNKLISDMKPLSYIILGK